MNDVMLDFETFGTGRDACIVQVGACYFDRATGEIGKTFKVNIDAASHVKRGAKIQADTVYWWLSQSKEAQNSILADPRLDVHDAFTQLNEFLSEAKHIWSHATFDFVILQQTMRQLEIKPTFHYKIGKDLRTLVDLAKTSVDKTSRTGIHHDALDDCFHQVKYCVEALNNILNLKKLNKVLGNG